MTLACSVTPSISRNFFLYMGFDLHQRHQTIRKLMADLNWNGEHFELLHIQLCCTHGFWKINTCFIDVHDWSYISCSINQKLGKLGWWTNYTSQNGNWCKTFIFKLMCLILYMCFTQGKWTYWRKRVKYVSSVTTGFLGYLFLNSTTPKRVTHLRT